MNDLDVLTTHGPAATPLRPEVLDRARAALLDEIAAEAASPAGSSVAAAGASAPVVALGRRLRRPIGRRTGIALVAACAAGVVSVSPVLLGSPGSSALALGPAAPPTFPLTPTSVPDGLGDPVFEQDLGFSAARYVGRGGDALSVSVADGKDHWEVPAGARHVDVAGHDGLVFSGAAHDGTTASSPVVRLVWQGEDGDWLGVAGTGTYADETQVEAFAESLRDRPQPVRLRVSVAPQGWSVARYKADRVVTYTPDGSTGPGQELTVTLLDGVSADLAADYGAREVTSARVQVSPATVGRTADGWVLEGRTASGQTFSVQAPDAMTRDQVVKVADGVTCRC